MKNKKMRATTLPELLVAMIVMGVLFMAVTDGFVLFRRFVTAFGEETMYNIDTLNQYYKINRYVVAGDTLAVCGDTLPRTEEHPAICKLKQEEQAYFQLQTNKQKTK